MSLSLVNVVVFFIILGVMIIAHELGHFIMAKRAGIKVEEFGFGYPPRIFGVRRGETTYSLNLIPIGGFVKMLGEEDPTDARSFARASKVWRTIVLVSGAGMNLVMAVLLFAISYMVGWPTPVQSEVIINQVQEGSPAAAAGLRPGDIVTEVSGNPVASTQDIRTAAHANAGRDVSLTVRRDDSEVRLTVQPRGEGPSQGTIGVTLGEHALKMGRQSYPLHIALVRGAQQTVNVIGQTFYIPVLAVRGQVPAEAARPVGPVGIYGVVSQAATETMSRNWWWPLAFTSALLSTGLGVANLLPIPGLDGGRLLFVVLEAIRRKRVSPEREGLIHLVGIAFLLSLVLIISYYDVLAPVGSIDWGPQ